MGAIASVDHLFYVQDLYKFGNVFRATTTNQPEWEMADDLRQPLLFFRQGGHCLPNSTHQRVVGKIFAAAGKSVSYIIYRYSVTMLPQAFG